MFEPTGSFQDTSVPVACGNLQGTFHTRNGLIYCECPDCVMKEMTSGAQQPGVFLLRKAVDFKLFEAC